MTIIDASEGELLAEFQADCKNINLIFSEELLARFIVSLQSKRFLLLTGLSGSGKTKLAQAFAQWITPESAAADVFLPGAKIPSSQKTYIVNRSDSLSVEFWNDENETGVTKVTLPREMIQEWATYILQHNLDEFITARDVRKGVVLTSRYSSQLHSFETHLKASAFALIKSERSRKIQKCYEIIPVGADWTSNENIVGYPNGLDAGAYVLTPCLSLILRALDPANALVPHFLILDEMNLSHVERYFADFLSALESGETIPLYEGPERRAGDMVIPQSLRLPPNLFVIGTVNVDETTYMFSPKVLDRANVLEFRMAADDLGAFLTSPGAPNLSALAGQGVDYAEAFVRAASREDTQVPVSVREEFASEMLLFFNLMQRHNVAFGYRVAHEAGRFLHFHALIGGHGDGDVDWFNSAMDAVIVQKLLPKLHGSRSRLEGLLWALAWACGASREDRDGQGFEAQLRLAGQTTNEGVYGPERLWETLARDHPDSPWLGARYPLSFEKVMRMWRALVRDQFVSFSEA